MADVHGPFEIATAFDTQGKTANQIPDPEQKKAAQQAYQQAMNDRGRQAAGPHHPARPLFARPAAGAMTWFWFNHFNVHQYKANMRVMVGDYEDTPSAPHALGRFRDLLTATLHHPAMLRYLDNADNAAGHINENYAREIMELHTMGVGSGYTQEDVRQLARILTGVGIDLQPEEPEAEAGTAAAAGARRRCSSSIPQRHDYRRQGVPRPHHQGHAASPRSTRRWTSWRASPRPPAHHVAASSRSISSPTLRRQRWSSGWRRASMRADGDIAAVLATMFHAPEFTRAAAGHEVQGPGRITCFRRCGSPTTTR